MHAYASGPLWIIHMQKQLIFYDILQPFPFFSFSTFTKSQFYCICIYTTMKSTRTGKTIAHLDNSSEEFIEYSFRLSNTSDASFDISTPGGGGSAPSEQSSSSPISKSPWTSQQIAPFNITNDDSNYTYTGLMGSLIREEGHIYSLATSGDLLYTGSDSKNIRVWKNQKEFSGFKSNSGLVKAIVIAGEKIFTGHQDGKIRLWKVSSKNPSIHKRIGSLPTFKSFFKNSMNPTSYVEVKRNRNAVWIRHFDAISCLSLNEDRTLLYSSSWDKTFKVWRVSNSKCLESVNAHDDAVNAVVAAGTDGLVFTGSADGTVKVWRREMQGKGTKHFFSQILLKQECAVTALVVDPTSSFVYSGSSDGLVNFWERAKLLQHGGLLRGHKLAVLCLAAAGNLVISGSADTNICVWRRDDSEHKCLSVLRGHAGPVKCLAVESDKESSGGGDHKRWIVYSGSLDKSVKIWRVSPEMDPMPTYRQPETLSTPQSIPSVQSVSRNTSQQRK